MQIALSFGLAVLSNIRGTNIEKEYVCQTRNTQVVIYVT